MAQTPQTRLSLIGRLHDPADSNAWHEFVQIYQPLIHRMVSRRGLQHADAAEVTQDVLGRIASVIQSWDPDPDKGSFRGWLYRMTRNLTVDFLRKNKLHQHHKATFFASSDAFGSSNQPGTVDNGIDFTNISVNFTGQAVPEPSSAVLLLGGLGTLGLIRRRAPLEKYRR